MNNNPQNPENPEKKPFDRAEYNRNYQKEYRKKNIEKKKAYDKQYREAHKEESKAYGKQYREEHKEEAKEYREKNAEETKVYQKEYREKRKAEKSSQPKIKAKRKSTKPEISEEQKAADRKEYNRQYRLKNAEKLKEDKKREYEENKEWYVQYNRDYREKNKESLREDKAEYVREKRKTDPTFRLIENMRLRVSSALRCQDSAKNKTTIDLLGCTPEFLKNYLESKFTEGMTWDNYGKKGWHVDHILPCASFDLTKEEEQKKCFHYTNLQPLWWLDNIKKSDKIL